MSGVDAIGGCLVVASKENNQGKHGEVKVKLVLRLLSVFLVGPLVACSPNSSFKTNATDDIDELEGLYKETSLEARAIGGASLTKCQRLMANAVTAAISDENNDPPKYGVIGCALEKIHALKHQTASVCDQRATFDSLLSAALQSPDCAGVVKEPFPSLIAELKPIVSPLVACVQNDVNACIKPGADGRPMAVGSGRRRIESIINVLENELNMSINAGLQGQPLNLTVLFQRLNALRLADHLYSGIVNALQRSAVLASSAIKNVPVQQTPLVAQAYSVLGPLNSRSVGVEMKVKKPHQNLAGAVFVMAIVQKDGGQVRYFLNPAFQWIKDDGVNVPSAFAVKQALSTVFKSMIQQNVDLTGFVGTQVFVGYGVGANAYSEMIASKRHINFYTVQP